jgi:gliding motility-associated-like protein
MLIHEGSLAQYLEFIENKGQWNKQVDFKSDLGRGAVFLKPGGYRVLLNNKEDLDELSAYYGHHQYHDSASRNTKKIKKSLTLRSHAYDVHFLKSSQSLIPIPEKYTGTYNNYFGGRDSSQWASGCKVYNAVVYKDLYKGIDIRYYADKGQLKYDLIVKAGADISNIAIQVTGADNLELNKTGNLSIHTSVGTVYESNPYVYQLVNNVRKQIKARYQLDKKNNIVRFALDSYSKDLQLVIDPALIFSTFTGSRSDNWGYTATYDNQGNLYAGGIAFGSGYPASTGAFSTVFQGGDESEGAIGAYDIAIIKFSSNGSQRLYGTYLGGNGNEQPHSLIADAAGNLVVAGRTSSTDFPQTSSRFGSGGGFDIFLTKFNAGGTALIGSRLVGGSGSDGVNIAPKYVSSGAIATRRNYGDDARSEVILDNAANIYLVSCTQSGDFPTTSNAFKRNLSGSQDGVFVKMTNDLSSIITSTLIGGGREDAAFVLAIHPLNGNVFIGGGTASNDLSKNSNATGPILFSNFQGGETDGFVAELNNDGNILNKLVYVGGSGNDIVYGLQFDESGFPYLTGTTTVSLPVVNAAFRQNGGKQFISKLNTNLDGIQYSTNFGKGSPSPDISPTAFLVDVCENVYVSGWGGAANIVLGYPSAGTTGLTVTPDAIFNTTDGSDFYFFVLEKDANSQLYGSFFGSNAAGNPNVFGDHVDGGTSRFDRRGAIYQAVCANCGRNGIFPTTAGVWSPGNQAQSGSLCNQAAIKIAFELSGVTGVVESEINGVPRDSTGCVPLTVDLVDIIAIGKTFIWDFGDGSPGVSTSVPRVTHTFTSVGDFLVRLISVDSTKCNISDTSFTTIKVRDNEALLSFSEAKLPPCDALRYEFTNTSIPPAGFSFINSSFTWDFGDNSAPVTTNATTLTHQFPAPGTYNVTLYLNDGRFCNSPDSVSLQIRVADTLDAQFLTPLNGCAPYNASFNNTSRGGNQFEWNFGDGTGSSEENPTHLFELPGVYTIKMVARDPNTCNQIDSTELTITVHGSPFASFDFTPKPATENVPTTFINQSTGAVRYLWDFGDGSSDITSSLTEPVTHLYGGSGSFRTCLTAVSSFGCPDDTCQVVESIIFSVVDVPSAFSPNGDGINDVIKVIGFGVRSIDFRIFNRWGQQVFQTNDIETGWDGRFNGVIQPQEVYGYTLNVTFFNNSAPLQKRGDITLLR